MISTSGSRTAWIGRSLTGRLCALVCLWGISTLLASVAVAETEQYPPGPTTAPAASEKGRLISASAALDEIQRGHAMLIDTRKPFERRKVFAAGTCAAIPYIMNGEHDDEYIADVLTAVKGDRHAPIVLISRFGMRAARAQQVLEANGFTDVRSVEGGFEALRQRDAGH
ncbi:MAG TPA: rhodanese-like domain-containing protein [Alphaproteobacteria bacterium]